jgi:hypothetical protein
MGLVYSSYHSLIAILLVFNESCVEMKGCPFTKQNIGLRKNMWGVSIANLLALIQRT